MLCNYLLHEITSDSKVALWKSIKKLKNEMHNKKVNLNLDDF